METATKKPTLEEVLEHSALFHNLKIWKLLKHRFKSVLWERIKAPARKQIFMTHEIEALKNNTKILKYKFDEVGNLEIITDKGTLKFSK